MPPIEITNHYDTLEVPFNATLKDINHSYKRLALKHHPDKAVDSDVDRFQQIQQAAETLRDPYRRKRHDHELRAHRVRKAYAEGPNGAGACAGRGGRGFYTKWMPRSFGAYSNSEFYYMYSYGNSVHMDPESKESKEDRERIAKEKKFDEMLRRRGEVSAEEVLRQFEWEERKQKQKVGEGVEETGEEKEMRRQEAMRARLERDEEETEDGEGRGDTGEGKEGCAQAEEEEHEEEHKEEPGEDHEQEQQVEHEEQQSEEEAGDGQQTEPGPASPVEGPDHENEEEDNHSSTSSEELPMSEYGTAQEGDFLHSDADDDGFSQHKPTIDEEDTVFYDCAERNSSCANSADTAATNSSEEESESSDEEAEQEVSNHNYASDKPSLLTPFIPYFMAKLNDASGKYTEKDLQVELRGMVMETYCGWLEGHRVTFSGAKIQPSFIAALDTDTAGDDSKQDCLHLGYWKKEFERPECEVCHRWKPVYTLTCPGCGIKACVECKFQG